MGVLNDLRHPIRARIKQRHDAKSAEKFKNEQIRNKGVGKGIVKTVTGSLRNLGDKITFGQAGKLGSKIGISLADRKKK